MAKTVDAIAKAIKKLGTADKLPSVPAVARELGESLDGKFVSLVYQAEPVAFPELKLAGTKAGVEKGRKSGLRFERIAARSGLTVAEVKTFAEQAGVADLYVGRGSRGGSGKPAGSSGRRAASPKKDTAASGRGTSGRRGAKTQAAASGRGSKRGAAASGRRGTRSSAAADPK